MRSIHSWLWLLMLVTLTAQALTEQETLDYCLGNGDNCAVSVTHLTQGWERHINADRLQVTASTFKILVLIAYAEAVVAGRIDPDRIINRDEWARFWVGSDGGSLSAAWNRLGQPVNVTVDEMARAMMQESDNAAPDWFLNALGEDALNQVIQSYVEGYHDPPKSINAIFLTHDTHPQEPSIGNRMVLDYSGFEMIGYQEELAEVFNSLHDPDFVRDARLASCARLPWDQDFPPCTPDFRTPGVNRVILTGRFFVRSTTRTYNQLMAGILKLDLLPPEVSDVVRKHLEFPLDFPNVAADFTRWGAKGGGLTPNDIKNWTTYMESRHTGDQVVVSIFLQYDRAGPEFGDIVRFAEAIIRDSVFASTVRDSIPVELNLPELALQITEFEHRIRISDEELVVTAQVHNVSPVIAQGPFTISLFLSEDSEFDAQDALLVTADLQSVAPFDSTTKRLTVAGLASLAGQFGIVVVDSANAIAESVENNNIAWQRVRKDLGQLPDLVGNADIASTLEGTPVNINVLENDTGVGSLRLLLDPSSGPENGSVFVMANDTISYTPEPGFVGADSFFYFLMDEVSRPEDTLVRVEVTVIPDNQPVANDHALKVDEDTVATIDLLSGAELGNQPTVVEMISNPRNGTGSVDANGVYTYRPNLGFTGTDDFDYMLIDNDGDMDNGTVNVVVAANEPDIAIVRMPGGSSTLGPLTIGLLIVLWRLTDNSDQMRRKAA